jgi:hypothetical protein
MPASMDSMHQQKDVTPARALFDSHLVEPRSACKQLCLDTCWDIIPAARPTTVPRKPCTASPAPRRHVYAAGSKVKPRISIFNLHMYMTCLRACTPSIGVFSPPTVSSYFSNAPDPWSRYGHSSVSCIRNIRKRTPNLQRLIRCTSPRAA